MAQAAPRRAARPGLLLLLLLGALVGLSACAESGGDAADADGVSLYAATCETCHGADGRGTPDGPSLFDRVYDMDADTVVDVILDGEGQMRRVELSVVEAEAVADYVLLNFTN